MKYISNSRGVTLIEIVSSLGILAVGIVSLLTLFPLALEESVRVGDRTTAALLGEYVIEQVRLHQDKIEPGDTTKTALENKDKLNWDDYNFDSEQYTFIDPEDDDFPNKNYGSGEQIVKQDDGELTDQELYSRYEVTIKLDEIEDDGGPNDAFTDGADLELMQLTVTVRWPRAFTDEEREKQQTMSFVTYIRPTITP